MKKCLLLLLIFSSLLAKTAPEYDMNEFNEYDNDGFILGEDEDTWGPEITEYDNDISSEYHMDAVD